MKTLERTGLKTKSELAFLYFPDLAKESAMQSFRRLIRKTPQLQNEFNKLSGLKKAHYLPPSLVCLIFDFLGNPADSSFRRSFVVAEKKEGGME